MVLVIMKLLLRYPSLFSNIFIDRFEWGLSYLVSRKLIDGEELLYLYLYSIGYSITYMSKALGVSLFYAYNKVISPLTKIQFLVGGAFYDEFFAKIMSELSGVDEKTIINNLAKRVKK